MVDGVLYVSTSLSQVAAIDAATGKTRWVYDPETWKNGTPSNNGFVHRGVAYWTDGIDRRLLCIRGAYLFALNPETGEPYAAFGDQGKLDLTPGLGPLLARFTWGSPALMVRDVIVVGASLPDQDRPVRKEGAPGDVRGYDVRTGRHLWTFHIIPREGEPGVETWEDGSWGYTGGGNVWASMSADEELGYVYLPTTSPTNDPYGGHRRGDNLYSSVARLPRRENRKARLALSARSPRTVGLRQSPTAPILGDITVGGRTIKAVVQVTKQAFAYVFDRVTGEPVWPIEERPVPQSTVPGEKTSPTQPFPTKPPPFDRQGISVDDLIDFTPELRKQALAVLEKYTYGPLFTPPSLQKPTILMPGVAGGASWSCALRPETGTLYIPSITLPFAATMEKSPVPHADYIGTMAPVETIQGVPLWKPLYGRITAIDLNTGRSPLDGPDGRPDAKQSRVTTAWASAPRRAARGHVLLTKTLLIIGQEGTTQRESSPQRETSADLGSVMVPNFAIHDPNLRVYDKATGKVVGEVALPRNATGAPMSYMLNGKQFIVVPTGGANLPAELIALCLL